MASKKRLEANRRNAKLGGVKSDNGKAISKYNAVKHGILGQAETEYERDLYSDVMKRLEEEYAPQTVLESILLERIAIHYLKLLRLQKAEAEYMKSILDPRKVRFEGGRDLSAFVGKMIVESEGYTPLVSSEHIEHLLNIYARYETTIENRLYKAIHELESLRGGRMINGVRLIPMSS
ncbi:hypothetical protein ACFLXE_00465 [Chloroflexota bacterium]